jgi:hypothetical protein
MANSDEKEEALEKAITGLRDVGLKEKDDLSGCGAEDWIKQGGDAYGYGINASDPKVRDALQAFVDACRGLNDMDLCI